MSLTTGVTATVTSISLTAGDWDVTGTVHFVHNAATVGTYYTAGINTATTMPSNPGTNVAIAGNQNSTAVHATLVPQMQRVSLSGSTTVYLVTQAGFTTNTLSAYGFLRARRVR